MNPAPPDLTQVLSRVATDERFVANVYWTWCGGKLDLEAVASELHATVDAIVSAGLCFRPRGGDHFSADVEKIADYAEIDATYLIGLIRGADTLAAFKQSPEQERFLAAARDARKDGDDE